MNCLHSVDMFDIYTARTLLLQLVCPHMYVSCLNIALNKSRTAKQQSWTLYINHMNDMLETIFGQSILSV